MGWVWFIIVAQFVMGMVLTAIFAGIWKATSKGEKLF